jgi:hypothetical protein
MTALWLLAWLVPGQLVEADDFPRPLQMKVVAASVRIVNRGEKVEGSGVIVGRKAGSLYVLTTAHLVSGQGRLEIATFSAESYPQEARVYTGAEVLARTKDVRDLALIRLATDDAPPGCLPLCPERLLPAKGGFEALSAGCGSARAPICLLEKVESARTVGRPGKMGTALFWEVAAEQAAGRSGGALVDRQGRLIGLASGASRGRGYYCHAREVRRWLKAGGYDFLLGDE